MGGPHPSPHPPRLLTAVRLAYTPTLAEETLGGLTTTSTFTLEQPRCVFTEVRDDAVIWLVVAVPEGRWAAAAPRGSRAPLSPLGSLLTPVPLPAAVPSFNDSVEPGTPERAFQRFPAGAPAYMTLNTTLPNYPCPKPTGEITVLRVGSETACAGSETRPTCNGPLPGPGPYR